MHLANGDGGGFQAQNLPCSGNGDAALAPKPAVCGALRGGDGTFLCMGVWLAEREGLYEFFPTTLLLFCYFYFLVKIIGIFISNMISRPY